MTYKQRYRAPKYGENAGEAAIVDTGDPYQNLANAIVEQAAEDYRVASIFLAKHPSPPKEEDYLTEEQIEILQMPQHRTMVEHWLLKRAKPPYKDEVLWEVETAKWWRIEQQRRVRKTEEFKNFKQRRHSWEQWRYTLDDCEKFFRGDWIKMLTRLDGEEILNRLKEELHGSKAVSPDG